MPAEYTYDYAIVRVVPRVERGEQMNVGVILSCPDLSVLDARIELDEGRLLALDPKVDLDTMRANLSTIRPCKRCDSMISGTSAARTWAYQTPSG